MPSVRHKLGKIHSKFIHLVEMSVNVSHQHCFQQGGRFSTAG